MSRVLLLLLSSWLVLFTCASAQRSCKSRCGESYFRGNECQCDYECLSHNECCRNFESECTTRGSCKGRCGEKFKRGRQCHCDVQCLKYNQCCPDYESQCVIADYSMEEEEPEEQEETPMEEDMANEDFNGSATRDTVSGNGHSVLVETTPSGTTPGGTTPGETSPSGTTLGETSPGGTTPGGTTPGRTTPGGTTPSQTEEATEQTTDSKTASTSATILHPETNSTGPVTTPATTGSDSNTGSTPDFMTTEAPSASSETVPQLTDTTSQSTSGGVSTSPTSESEETTSAVGNTEPMVSFSTSALIEPSEMSSEIATSGSPDQTPGTSLQTTSEPITLDDDPASSPDKSTLVSSAMTVSTEAASETPTSTPTMPLTTQGPESIPQTTTTPSTPAYNDDLNTSQTTQKASITDMASVPATTPSVKIYPTTQLTNKVPEEPGKPKEPSNNLNENSYDVQSDANYDPNLCSGNPVNGLTTLRNGTVVVFRGHFFWVLDSRRQPGQAQSIEDVWGIPSPIDTVFTRCNCLGKTYFFKGGKYWRFENDIMDVGFPKLISDGFGLRGHISAALSMPKYRSRRESVFFFKSGGIAQRYTYKVTPTCSNKSPVMRLRRAAEPELGQEISLKTLRGFPSSVTSAISVPFAGQDGYKYYVFSKTNYYNLKMEGDTPLILTPRAGPEKQKLAKSWFRCPKK